MKENYVDVTVLMDRSGSMSSIKDDMEKGFDYLVEEQKKAPGELKFTLFQFDTEFENVYEGVDIYHVPKLSLQPRGCTALLDALYKSMVLTGERLDKMDEKDKPTKVQFIVITDGLENSSKEITKEKMMDLKKQQEEVYNWEFIYLGADEDAIQEAEKYGFASGNIGIGTTNPGVMYSNLSNAMIRSRTGDIGNTGGYFDEDEQDSRE